MSKEYLCQYGNCVNTKTPIIVTRLVEGGGGDRARFCCEKHAALWLLRRSTVLDANEAAYADTLLLNRRAT